MPKAFETWTVLKHRPLTQLEENLWRVEGKLPDMDLGRAMTVVRLADGRLLIHNAIALEESEQQKLDALGPVAFIVVPNGWHRLDCKAYATRYPEAKVVCPAGSRKKVEQVVRVDLDYGAFEPTPPVRLEHLAGSGDGEGVLIVESEAGATLVFNDALFNLPHLPGVFGTVYRLIGSTGGPKVTRIARWFMVKDKAALRAHLERLAATPRLRRAIPGHGAVIDQDASGVLANVAAAL